MCRLLLIPLIYLVPVHLLFASVSISEIAWMGSTQSANHEWIELFNDGDSINVDGWTLGDGNNLTIDLEGIIPANTYVVLERNRSDGGSVVGTPFLNYTGALVNTGATLTLRRADGSVVDSVSGGEDWQLIGGDNTTKDTAQYTSAGWITGVPTPGGANTTTASPPSTSSTNSTQTSGSNGQTVLYGSTATIKQAVSSPTADTLSLELSVPNYIYEGQPVSFVVTPRGLSKVIRNSLKYQWNFGDLHTTNNTSPTHTYAHAGTYNLVVQANYASYHASARREVTVLPLTVSLAHSQQGDVLLQNDAMYEVDISGYRLTASKSKTIPDYTYISPRETITIPWQILGTAPYPVVVLFDRDRRVITSTNDSNKIVSEHVVASASVDTAQPVVSSGEETGETLPVVSAFGFTAAEASTEIPASESEIGVPANSVLDEEDQQGGDAFGVTPLLTSTTTTPSTPSTWWVYVVFVLVLAGATAGLLLRPKK